MKKILLYGGTFDPPHLAHVALPLAAMQLLEFDQVLYVPAHHSPLKDLPHTSHADRLAMLELALQDCPWAEISTIELERGGTSYTIDTIKSLQQEGQVMRLLIGADQWAQFKEWINWEEILEIASPAIMPREGFELSSPRLLQIAPLPAISTDIRELLHDGESVEAFISSEVCAYITEHQLYQ
ncbi:nicotinate (nicotinamide) nucleotide adenylyltransferase [bacterium]|nr:nicotinate (nicotinamide) nucleotide adenylyltransferase [bacterium]